jgi:hypothetical protein
MPPPPATFTQLGADLLGLLLQYMCLADLGRAGRVCRAWGVARERPGVWKRALRKATSLARGEQVWTQHVRSHRFGLTTPVGIPDPPSCFRDKHPELEYTLNRCNYYFGNVDISIAHTMDEDDFEEFCTYLPCFNHQGYLALQMGEADYSAAQILRLVDGIRTHTKDLVLDGCRAANLDQLLTLPMLCRLQLGGAPIDDQLAQRMAATLARNAVLTTMSLADSQLTDTGLAALLQGFRACELMDFSVVGLGHCITEAGMEMLRASLMGEALLGRMRWVYVSLGDLGRHKYWHKWLTMYTFDRNRERAEPWWEMDEMDEMAYAAYCAY